MISLYSGDNTLTSSANLEEQKIFWGPAKSITRLVKIIPGPHTLSWPLRSFITYTGPISIPIRSKTFSFSPFVLLYSESVLWSWIARRNGYSGLSEKPIAMPSPVGKITVELGSRCWKVSVRSISSFKTTTFLACSFVGIVGFDPATISVKNQKNVLVNVLMSPRSARSFPFNESRR